MFVLVFVWQPECGTAEEGSICAREEFRRFSRTPHSAGEQEYGGNHNTEQVGFVSAPAPTMLIRSTCYVFHDELTQHNLDSYRL